MKKPINLGYIENGAYIKNINFSKAVLWKDRELSLPPKVIQKCETAKVKKYIFNDYSKMKRWIFDAKNIYANMKLKRVGQEKQYYFSIDLRAEDEIKLEN